MPFPILAGLLAVGGAAANAYGAYKATDGLEDNLEAVEGYLQPWMDAADDMQGLSNQYLQQAGQFMDRGSAINQEARREISQEGMDFVSQQNRLNTRNMYGGGVGGFSGVQAQQSRAASQQASAQSEDAFRQQLQANRGTGLALQGQGANLLDKYMSQQKAYGETMAQGWLTNDQLQRQSEQAAWSGLGSGLSTLSGML